MTLRGTWKITKQTISGFIDDKVLKLSAALAYYTIFSLPGLIIIVVWVSDIFYGDKAVEGTVYAQIAGLVGRDAALQIQQTIRNATLSYETGFAATVGIATLVIGATSIFGEIQDSINTIWKLKAKPRKGWVKMIINRLLSFSIIIVLGFLLLVSLVVNAVMDAFIDKLTAVFPHTEVLIAYVFNMLLSFAITSFLFGLIFKVLPDAKIEWRHVRAGAFTTALLFMAGKFGISYYLGHNRLSSAYGAAGSVIVILLWVYYSATILYFGAVFTRVYAIHKGSRIYPDDYAVWIEQVEVESDQSVQERPETKTVIDPNGKKNQ